MMLSSKSKLGCILLGCFLFMAVLVGCGQSQAPAAKDSKGTTPAGGKKLISIATAAMGGTYYPVGVGMSEIFNKKMTGVEARVEVTGGTVENPDLVNTGSSDIGLANTDMAYFAYNGQPPFKKEMKDIRSLFNGLSPGVVHYVVMENSPIKTLADLKGKKIAVGPQGNSTSLFLRKVITELGFTWNDIRPSYVSFSDGVEALSDGKVDMAIIAAGLPSPAVKELVANKKAFRILEFEPDFISAFLKKNPYYIEYTIPAATYGMKNDIKTIATQNMVIVNAKLDNELVYKLTQSIFENLSVLHTSHPSAITVTLDKAGIVPIPLHPGAEKYFREKGVVK